MGGELEGFSWDRDRPCCLGSMPGSGSALESTDRKMLEGINFWLGLGCVAMVIVGTEMEVRCLGPLVQGKWTSNAHSHPDKLEAIASTLTTHFPWSSCWQQGMFPHL